MAQAPPRSLGRISEIAQVAVRHGFGYFFRRNKLTDLIGEDGEVLSEAPSERGRHLREMLDELGPTFVKFGQLLSMRPDVLPPDIIAELRGLQDDVSPFSYEEAAQVIEESLGQPVERLFREFDPVPMAAASIGQVHRAVLPNGRTVAVKVQRPGAPRQIEADLNLMYQAARLAKERVRALDFIDAQGARRRVRPRDSTGARLPPRGAQRGDLPQELRGPPARQGSAGLLDVHAAARAHARAHRRHAARRRRHARLRARGAAPARRGARRHVDDDDLPPRLLPRRPAPGEHPRPLPRQHRPRRLRARRPPDRRGRLQGDTALHRRRERERRGDAETARRSRRPLPARSARRSSSPSCASSSTATTARRSRRSTRSRSCARSSG